MYKHCLMLAKQKQVIPEHFKGLKEVLAAIQPEYEPTAATASVTDSLPALDDTTPQCSMLRTESQQPDETPFSMRAAHEIPDQTAATAWPLAAYHVPYLEDGFIDWSQVDSDDLSAPESDEESEVVEAAELDFDRALPSNLNPHYHQCEDPDCVMVGHRCNCPQCQELSPTRKRKRESVAAAPFKQLDAMAIAVPPPQPVPAPAADIQTVDWSQADLRVPGSPPPLGLVVSENLRTAIETVDDRADNPAPASKENAVSSTATGEPMRKRMRPITPYGGSPDEKGSDNDAQPKLKAPAATAKGTGRKAKTKGKATGKAKGKAKGKAEATANVRPVRDLFTRDFAIGPPFLLTHRSTPPKKAQAYISGTVNGELKKIITNINVNMSKDYSPIMMAMLKEAKAGKYKNKGEAIDRRDELLKAGKSWPDFFR